MSRFTSLRQVIAVIFFSLLFINQAIADDDDYCSQAEVGAIPLVETTVFGNSTFCEFDHGLKGKVRARGLVPGNAYTVWWVYFDDPSQCADGPGLCGMADFGGDNPLGVFGRMDSGVASGNGKLTFRGRVPGMQASSGAQVWLLVFGHGPANYADGRHLARQLLTPEDPLAGVPHLGNNVDGPLGYPVGVSVFVVD